jgi:hypothetical protein
LGMSQEKCPHRPGGHASILTLPSCCRAIHKEFPGQSLSVALYLEDP